MAVYDTPNSTHTYQVPAEAVAIDILVRGGPGGSGMNGYQRTLIGNGGNAGEVTGTLSVSGGESLTVYVGAAGMDGNRPSGGASVQSPVDGGVSSGEGSDGEWGGDGGGGSGGTPSAIEHPDGSYLALGEGGGGGAGMGDSGSGGAGGGGARGGLGGAGGVDTGAGGSRSGGDATGTGSGGNGGDSPNATTVDYTSGQPGGTVTHADLTDVTTTTSASGPVVEITARTPPPAPTNLSIDGVRATELDISWTDNATDEHGYRVYTSTDGGDTWTQVADLAANTTSYTLSGLDTGREYHVRVEVYNDVGGTSDTAGPATTVLPDADQPVLGNGVEDEIAVDRESAPTNYGSVRWQVRETGQSSWSSSATGFAEGTVSYDTTTFPITGREDGERYEVRLRTETPAVAGAWTTPVAITTKLPTPAGATATADSPTQATVTWTDQADNEDGFRVERRRIYADGPGSWQKLADLSPNTEQFVDDTASPDAQLEFRVTAYTEDATATETASVTMPALAGTTSSPVASSGYSVEIERSDGTIRRPSPLDGVTEQPRLNGRPQIELPLRPDLSWLDASWEGATLRVWRDGVRLPIDEVVSIEPGPGQTTLRGRGGAPLRTRHTQDVTDKSAHDVCRDILDTTGVSYTVDAAPTDTGVEIVTIDSQEELTDALDVADDVPVTVSNGRVKPLRSAYLVAANDFSTTNLVSRTDQNWTVSEAVSLDVASGSTSSTAVTFSPDYPIPADRVGVAVRVGDEYIGVVRALLDGTVVAQNTNYSQGSKSASWFGPGSGAPELSPATSHTLTIETQDGGLGDATGTAYIDAAVVYDTRYHSFSNFDNTLNSSNLLDGPPGPYGAVDADFVGEAALDRVTGGRIETTVSSTANGQAVAIRPSDPDVAWTTAANSSTVETDFASDYSRLDARVTLSATDGDVGNNVTIHRTQPQHLESLTITADLLRSATVAERTLDGRAETLLSQIADRGDLIWEVQWRDGQQHVVVTRPGQRTSTADPDLVDWTVSKDLNRQLTQVAVYGSSQRVAGESFVADLNSVSLDYDRIQQGSERVYSEASDGSVTVYERGSDADYEMDYLLGNIRIVADSDMVAGQSYQIDYNEQALGERFVDDGTAHRYPTVQELPSLHTDLQCERAAGWLLRQADGPLWSATVTIPDGVGFALTESIDPSRIPTPPGGAGLRVESIDNQPGQVRLQLGVGQSLDELVSTLQNKLSETARQT